LIIGILQHNLKTRAFCAHRTFGLTGIATICPVTFGVTSTTRPVTVTRPDGVRIVKKRDKFREDKLAY
jgi:hypothetical protein